MPHAIFPWDLLDSSDDDDDVQRIILEYFAENWSDISASLKRSVSSYDLDDETKQTFYEALDAHGHGMYRTSPRLLFPELERAVRIKFNDGAFEKGHASQRQLRDWLREQPSGKVFSIDYASWLLSRFLDDIYARVENEEEIARASSDTLPNRHAAVHGVVVYNTALTSLNTIVMTAFIFELFEVFVANE